MKQLRKFSLYGMILAAAVIVLVVAIEIALVRLIVAAPSRRAYRNAQRLAKRPLGGPVPNLGSRAHI